MADESGSRSLLELRTQLLRLQANLFDPQTHLPALPAVLDDVRRLLDTNGVLHLVAMQVEQEQNLEEILGWEEYDRILSGAVEFVRQKISSHPELPGLLCQDAVRGDLFLAFFPDRSSAEQLLDAIANEAIPASHLGGEAAPQRLRGGLGSIRRRAVQRTERCIYGGIREAVADLERRRASRDEDLARELERILTERDLITLFQPIVESPGRRVAGYEALSRGPLGGYLEPADNLLGFAERAGMLGQIELLCVEQALRAAHRLPDDATVFLNLSPQGLEYIESSREGLKGLADRAGWKPQRSVLEITERNYADSPAQMRRQLARLRQAGFRLAIDDMGTGFSSLHSVAELKPDFIKLDQTLVRDLEREPIKRNLVSAITGFAETSHATVIAEGVESQREAAVLEELGVSLLQGFLFGVPEAV